jgi:DNA-binding response OmpR family regulator
MKTELRKVKGQSILVVDDDRTIGRLIKCNLENRNTRVLETASGFECIKILHKTIVDLIILDIVLPDFNGWGILSLLRLTEQFRLIPVIMISAEPPDKTLIERLRPDDYVQKPFDIRDLLVRLRRCIDSRSSHQLANSEVI